MKKKKILIVTAVLVFLISPSIAERVQADPLFTLGHADRTYDYQSTIITCYLGQLFPGQPIYWCMYQDGSMDHSWFVYQVQDMDRYYTGGLTGTYTATPKGRLN